MSRSITKAFMAAGFMTAAAATTLAAQERAPKYSRDLPAKLVRQTKVSESDAARTAAARVPKGKIQGVELENENGRLIYSYELKVPGKSGVEEVNVNAKTGVVVNVEHEGPAAEANEAKSEAPHKKPV